MKLDFKKINFKQPKYMLPLVALVPLLFIAWQISDIFTFQPKEDNGPVITETVNTDMPEAVQNRDSETKSKYQAMLDGFGQVTDYTGVGNVEKEEEELMHMDKIYEDREKARIDSMMAIQTAKAEELKRQLEAQERAFDEQRKNEANIISREQAEQEQKFQNRQDQILEQMRLAQKMANGEPILTKEEEAELEKKRIALEERQRVLDSIALAQGPVSVTKNVSEAEKYFNTVSDEIEDPKLIKARVDRVEKVRDGSRIRLRLSEDVQIEGELMPEGSYLYATITGFTAQRVKANVTSAMLGSAIKKVNLAVYDLDGMEGFYVPSSNFREVAKDVGSRSMQMNLNMNNGSDMSMESLAMQSLQQAIQGTTSAISNSIKANRARIKMNTNIYLVDMSNEQ